MTLRKESFLRCRLPAGRQARNIAQISASRMLFPGSYKILKRGRIIVSPMPGRYAGHRPRKIFGRLDCASGRCFMRKENRVFFHTWEDAIKEGYRPCKKCKPTPDNHYTKRRRAK